MKPTGKSVAAAAVQAVGMGYTYDEMDCQAFVEYCVKQAGGRMDYRGSNDMARGATLAGTADDPIPYEGNMALENGKYYSQDGVVYRCTRDTGNPVFHALSELVGLYVEAI